MEKTTSLSMKNLVLENGLMGRNGWNLMNNLADHMALS
jgi:hypothetical protein